MKINEGIKIVGKNVILVPYEEKHVEKYHNWMKSPELQNLTASEPLSLDEEYNMQKSWRNDEDKCTFLILSKEAFSQTQDEIESLIGDTNLFLQNDPDDENEHLKNTAEAEIMIADDKYRGKKLGWEAMLLMLKYGQHVLNISKFIAKINEDNMKSIKMFKKMQFVEISKSTIFQEITLQRVIDKTWINWLNEQVLLDMQNYEC